MPPSNETAAPISPADRFNRQWHYRPETPIRVSPVFSWPPQPISVLRWFAVRWAGITENTILTVVALLAWFYVQPSMEEAKTFAWDWIGEMYLRNLVLMVIVAGGLHLYFYTFNKQHKELRHDTRELPAKGRHYTFGNQVYDNMFWTLASGVTFWTAYEALLFWAMANGYAPVLRWQDSPVWFVAVFLLTPAWISLHFYLIHRALHWRPLFELAHRLHHRNNNVGPWSGLSMHPIEHLLFFSSILIHIIVPVHPVHILFHMQHQALTASTSHTGFTGLVLGGKNRYALGTFHHQMHHRYLDCNYGNLEVPCDQWFGSFHDGTAESHERLFEKRRQQRA
ncbi:MAG: sterol desaturase family protein [Pseudomonadota bacterium]